MAAGGGQSSYSPIIAQFLAKRAPFASGAVAICSQPMLGSHLSFGFSYKFLIAVIEGSPLSWILVDRHGVDDLRASSHLWDDIYH